MIHRTCIRIGLRAMFGAALCAALLLSCQADKPDVPDMTPAPGAPAAPTMLQTTAVPSGIDISWQASSGTVTHYKVEFSTDAGTTWETAATRVTGTTYSHANLDSSLSYRYRVTPYNGTVAGTPATTTGDATPMDIPTYATGSYNITNTAAVAATTQQFELRVGASRDIQRDGFSDDAGSYHMDVGTIALSGQPAAG